MKLNTTLLIAGLVSGMLATAARAQDEAAPVTDVEHCAADGGVGILPVDDTGIAESGEGVDPKDGEPVPEGEVTVTDEVGEVIDPAVCGEGVPIDWIKRGDGGEEGIDPQIYYMNAGGPELPSAAAEAMTDAAKDEALPLPKARIAPVKAIERKSSKPSAVIKSGRVFLRR